MASAVASLAVLGALAACAHRPLQVGVGEQPEHPTKVSSAVAPPASGVTPDWPGPPAGVRVLPPAQVDPSALPAGYPRAVWTQGDDRTVGLYGQEGGCTRVQADLREQTPRLIRIALVEITASSGPCTKELRVPSLAVQLDAPLEHRTVVLERKTVGPQPGR